MYDADKNELDILEFWNKHDIFKKSVEERPENKPYVFYDGPPFATGLPHYGHILSSVIKDVVPRYWTMKGYRVRRRWGWDCHGLPIESLIEKELQVSGKKQIEDNIGVDQFNEACQSKVLLYTKEWKKMVDRIGRWVEFDNAYKTMDATYMESVWWALKTIWDKELIYEGKKVLLYCPRCETPVSKAEVAMDNSYKDVTEEAVIVKFRLQTSDFRLQILKNVGGPIYFLAWTTTPWTLPGNVALAVGKNIEYILIESEGSYYIVAKERVSDVFQGREYAVVEECYGKDLVGLEYEPLFDMPKMKESGKKAYFVAEGDFVTTDEGTGIVHTAVMYGEDDYNLGVAIDLPMVPMLDQAGHYNDVAPQFVQGQYYKKAEKLIKKNLEDRGLIFSKQQNTHSYPHCWRCDTPLIYNAISAWFINIQNIKQRLIELNKKINWYPDHLKEGRFLNILETAPDWNISRNRYWATPLPFWKHVTPPLASPSTGGEEGTCNNVVCIGSVAELKEKAVNFDDVFSTDNVEELDLHKQYADKIVLRCNACGGDMKRIPEVIDCWVESGSMPFAEFNYPFENKDVFEARFPGQYIAEYIAQTRAWFYYMHVVAVLLFDNISFENVVTTGTIMNEKGEKLSKSKQNYTDPWIIIKEYGVDALRYYLMTSVVMQAENLFFSDREVRDVYNKIVNILWNVVEFYSMYETTNSTKDTKLKFGALHILDQWILARLNELVREVTMHMDAYDTVRAGRPIKEFIDDLSTWYVRRSRDRFKSDNEEERAAAFATLRQVLLTLSKVMAPFTPFLAEKMYQIVGRQTSDVRRQTQLSVHLETWPEATPALFDEDVLQKMKLVRKIVEMGLSSRKEAGMKVRQPLSIFAITVPGLQHYHDIIADELNVKEVIIENDVTGLPGKWVGRETPEVSVALNVDITPELEKEGLVREIVRAINMLRKEQKLTIHDTAIVRYQTDDDLLHQVFQDYADAIQKQVVASGIIESDVGGELQDIDGHVVRLALDSSA